MATRRYQSTSSGLKAMVALVDLRNKAIKPFASRRPRSTPITPRAEFTARSALRSHSYGSAICFPGTGVGGLNIRNVFSDFAVKRLKRGKIERQKRQKLALRFQPIAFHGDLLRFWIFAGLDFVRRVAGCSDSGHQRVKAAHRCTKF